MFPKGIARIAVCVSMIAMTVSATAVPAYALQDTAIDGSAAQHGFAMQADNEQNSGRACRIIRMRSFRIQ